jgi:hypothetical protein
VRKTHFSISFIVLGARVWRTQFRTYGEKKSLIIMGTKFPKAADKQAQ